MACSSSFTSAKLLSTVVSNAIYRRGYSAAASQGSVVSRGSNSTMMKKSGGEVGTADKVSWVPDPVTGYYRPETGVKEIDAAELRALLLKPNN